MIFQHFPKTKVWGSKHDIAVKKANEDQNFNKLGRTTVIQQKSLKKFGEN